MLGHQFAFSSAPIRRVREVQFGILSPEEIVCGCRELLVPDTHLLASPESLLCCENRTPRYHR